MMTFILGVLTGVALLAAWLRVSEQGAQRRQTLIVALLSDAGPMTGLELVRASGGLLPRGIVYVDLERLVEQGVLESRPVAGYEGDTRRIYSLRSYL